MRKPPELVVTLAPLLVLLLVLAGAGVVWGLPGGSDTPEPAAAPASSTVATPTAPQAPVLSEVLPTEAAPAPRFRNKVERLLKKQPAFSFQIATLNVLGHSHTVQGGDRASFADSGTRMGWSLGLLHDIGIDVVGFQELQAPQWGSFRSRTGGGWDSYPGTALGRLDVDNTLAWDTSVFRAIERHTIAIPYFYGRTRQMPYVLLEHLGTKQRIWVANFHNPAQKYGASHAQHRREATRREINLANELSRTGLPVFFTGDMNEREEYCYPVTSSTDLRWAGGSCSGARRMPVDWILGSSYVGFSGYTIAERGIIGRITDHPLVYATATVPETRAPSRS